MSDATQERSMRLYAARWRLALVWFPCSGLFILLLVLMSLNGAFGALTQQLWGWALPNLLPTLALMISVFAANALTPAEEETASVRRNFWLLSMALSIFYIALLFAPLLTPALKDVAPTPNVRMAALEMSNMWLGPVQGLLVMVMGVLFFSKEPQK